MLHRLTQLALEQGFDQVGPLDPLSLEFLPEVREMCAADRCRSYNKTWTCPPACGTLEEISDRCRAYAQGLLLQSTGTLEDDFDIEGMQELEQRHRRSFYGFVRQAMALCPNALPMGMGSCTLCQDCTWPQGGPCRHPDLAFPSMEAYGLFVSRVCERAGMKYYYGPHTMTYTSCILF